MPTTLLLPYYLPPYPTLLSYPATLLPNATLTIPDIFAYTVHVQHVCTVHVQYILFHMFERAKPVLLADEEVSSISSKVGLVIYHFNGCHEHWVQGSVHGDLMWECKRKCNLCVHTHVLQQWWLMHAALFHMYMCTHIHVYMLHHNYMP